MVEGSTIEQPTEEPIKRPRGPPHKEKPINKKPQENKETPTHTPIGESKKEKARGRPRIYDARSISKPKDPADAKHIIIM